MLTVGIDGRILQDSRRGQGQYAYYLIRSLAEVAPENRYRVFYNGFRKGAFAFGDDIPAIRQVWCRLPGRVLKPLWSRFAFPPAEYLLGRVDVFHHTFNFNFTHYTPVPSRAPMVVTFNGMADPGTIWQDPDTAQIERWFRIVADRAAVVIAVSEETKRDLLRRVRIAEEKVRVIHYGVSEAFRLIDERPRLETALARYGLVGIPYILYVGASDRNKNLSGLVRAFAALAGGGIPETARLVLAGPVDDGMRRIQDEARSLGIGNRVICTGHVSHDDLPCLYNGARLFVLPTFYEPFGIPLLEAMACGTPVVASRAGGIPEVVGEAALLFDPQDPRDIAEAMRAALTDEPLRHRLRQQGPARAAAFTWEKTARKTLAAYREAARA